MAENGRAENHWLEEQECPSAVALWSRSMSLYGALLTGVSGLDANSRALSITSSNISNVNTVGYKTSQANFSTFLASSGSAGDISPASVQVNSSQRLTQQ